MPSWQLPGMTAGMLLDTIVQWAVPTNQPKAASPAHCVRWCLCGRRGSLPRGWRHDRTVLPNPLGDVAASASPTAAEHEVADGLVLDQRCEFLRREDRVAA